MLVWTRMYSNHWLVFSTAPTHWQVCMTHLLHYILYLYAQTLQHYNQQLFCHLNTTLWQIWHVIKIHWHKVVANSTTTQSYSSVLEEVSIKHNVKFLPLCINVKCACNTTCLCSSCNIKSKPRQLLINRTSGGCCVSKYGSEQGKILQINLNNTKWAH